MGEKIWCVASVAAKPAGSAVPGASSWGAGVRCGWGRGVAGAGGEGRNGETCWPWTGSEKVPKGGGRETVRCASCECARMGDVVITCVAVGIAGAGAA
jgi:hypothetical protein